jgi:transcriptional regulator with XRE-family HTH domain
VDTEFVPWLAKEMEKRGWTQTELARRAGIVPSYMSMVMTGLKRPSTGACVKVATALGMSPERVLRIGGYLPPVTEERLREFDHVAQVLASLPDGPIREEAIAAIMAIVESAQRRALKDL